MAENLWNSGMYEEDIKIKSTNPKWRKLVDYYNQMREERFGEKGYFKYTMRFDEVHLISKHMGFIKRLVDNNKIDFSREGDLSIELVNLFERKLDNAEGVIALLSIQDNPISFLIGILR